MAIRRKDLRMVRVLLNGGADPNAPMYGDAPLTLAELAGDDEVVQAIRAAGGVPGSGEDDFAPQATEESTVIMSSVDLADFGAELPTEVVKSPPPVRRRKS